MKKPLKVEDLPKIEEVTPEEFKAITGGKPCMPAGKMDNYRLLKIQDPKFVESLIKGVK
jgi:hypothetical protein